MDMHTSAIDMGTQAITGKMLPYLPCILGIVIISGPLYPHHKGYTANVHTWQHAKTLSI